MAVVLSLHAAADGSFPQQLFVYTATPPHRHTADEIVGLTFAAVTAGELPHTEVDVQAKLRQLLELNRTEVFAWRNRAKPLV